MRLGLSTPEIRMIGMGILYILILMSGFFLSRLGRPLNTAVFTIHKLVSIAAVIVLLMTIIQINRTTPLNGLTWAALVATGIFFLGEMISGGFLSFDNFNTKYILTIHRILPVLIILFTTLSFYLIYGKNR